MVGPLELKIFNELRPGIILWAHIDISMACKQSTLRGDLTNSMILTLFFHFLYISDAVYNEVRGKTQSTFTPSSFLQPAVLTVMDATTDGFGYMLSIGDLLWVPFTYTVGARYLAFEHYVLGPAGTVLVLLVNATGYWIFRSANGEKNDFRNGHNPKSARFLSPSPPSASTPWCRSQVHVHEEGDEASYIGLVGNVPTSQLLVSVHLAREKQVV